MIQRFLKLIPFLIRFFNRPNIPFKSKALVIIGFAYIICPLDFVPDFYPFVGWIEDFIVGWLTLKYVSEKMDQDKNEVKGNEENTITVNATVIEEE